MAQFQVTRRWLIRNRWLDRLLAPRVALNAFDDGGAPSGTGPAFTGLVRDQLTTAAAGSGKDDRRFRLDRAVADTNATSTLAAVGDVSPPFKAAAAILGLVQWALPRARLSASGVLQATGSGGEGASFTLDGGHTPVAASLWSGAPLAPLPGAKAPDGTARDDPGSAYAGLAVPVAAWIDWQVRAALTPDEVPTDDDPKTYALLRGAAAADRHEDHDGALRFYGEVLLHDPDNIVALINHANLRARHRGEYDAAAAQLYQALIVMGASA
jgi:hypothetical protein